MTGSSTITLLEQGPLQGHNAWERLTQYTSANKGFVVTCGYS